jgi:hypothetical protein
MEATERELSPPPREVLAEAPGKPHPARARGRVPIHVLTDVAPLKLRLVARDRRGDGAPIHVLTDVAPLKLVR